MGRLTQNEKDILRQAVSVIESALERQTDEPEDSMWAYHVNIDKFCFAMDKAEYKAFISGAKKF